MKNVFRKCKQRIQFEYAKRFGRLKPYFHKVEDK